MAAPCVVCSVTLKSGENTVFKHIVTTDKENKFTHESLRSAVSNIQSDVNSFLTVQVEEEKLQNANAQQRHRERNSSSAAVSGDKTADTPFEAGLHFGLDTGYNAHIGTASALGA